MGQLTLGLWLLSFQRPREINRCHMLPVLSGHYCCREINEISEDFALPSAEKGYEWDYNEFLRYFIVDGCLGAISYIYQRKATKGVLKKKKAPEIRVSSMVVLTKWDCLFITKSRDGPSCLPEWHSIFSSK